jgi:hypothetical protein
MPSKPLMTEGSCGGFERPLLIGRATRAGSSLRFVVGLPGLEPEFDALVGKRGDGVPVTVLELLWVTD